MVTVVGRAPAALPLRRGARGTYYVVCQKDRRYPVRNAPLTGRSRVRGVSAAGFFRTPQHSPVVLLPASKRVYSGGSGAARKSCPPFCFAAVLLERCADHPLPPLVIYGTPLRIVRQIMRSRLGSCFIFSSPFSLWRTAAAISAHVICHSGPVRVRCTAFGIPESLGRRGGLPVTLPPQRAGRREEPRTGRAFDRARAFDLYASRAVCGSWRRGRARPALHSASATTLEVQQPTRYVRTGALLGATLQSGRLRPATPG